ncbi:MAG: hypothetical protein KDA20_13340 [Phycisphaerales bacterium]|nr:hypothetical protein [Phycisphaerales bacterium]
MNLPPVERKTIVTGAMFLAPVLVVQLALPLHGVMGNPQSASATPVNPEVPVLVAPPPKPTESQLAAIEQMDLLRGDDTPVQSPFYYPPKLVEVRHEDPVVITHDRPQFRITSILEARDGRVLAMINGKMCAVGAAPAEGWTITAIDANAKTVTVRSDAEGEELLLQFGRESSTGGPS